MQNKIIAQIPFEGFYESVCDMLLDDEINYHIESLQDENLGYDDYPNYSIDRVYLAKEYVKAYSEWLIANGYPVINLEFESLLSPREYNFTTDRIFCHVSMQDIETFYKAFIAKDDSQQLINNMFKSRDGFYSFYNDFVDNWKTVPLVDWDYNQLMVLFPIPKSYHDVWEDAKCNGVFNNAIVYID